jgi:MFS superfamily sulfate permease-like transporter
MVHRIDTPLFFVNAGRFHARIADLAASTAAPLERLVVNVEPLTTVDTPAADILLTVRPELEQQGGHLTR